MNQNPNITSINPKFDILPTGTQEAITKVDLALNKVQAITAAGQNITTHIAQTVIEVKQMQAAIQQMDLQVEIICKEFDMRIEKNKLAAPIIQQQLSTYSTQMDHILNRVLEMDPNSADQNYIKSRSELISMLNSISTNISNMFMNFIIS
jgi:hypothetical protein